MRVLMTGLALASLVISSACGAPAPPPVAPPLDVPAVATGPTAAARDTRPSPSAPRGMTGTLRVRDVGAVAREVFSMMGVPPGFDPTQILQQFVDADILAAIDLGAPMDALNIDVPQRRAASAFTLRAEGESLLREHFDLRPEGALLHLEKKVPEKTSHTLPSCALHAGRLVCAYDDKTLAESAPYLVTTLGAEPLDHSIRISVPGAMIRTLGNDDDGAKEERFVTELVRGLKNEIDRVDLDVDLGTTCEATLTLQLLSRDAPLTRALVPSGRLAPPPPAFDRLPADALLALWSNGAAAEDLAPLKKAIADDLQSTLESDGYAPEAAKASIDELSALFLTGGSFVLAAGKAKTTTWFVAAVDEPAQRWTSGLRALVKKSDEAERTRKKPSSAQPRRHPDGDDVAARIATIPASAKVPPDSLHIELKFTPKKKGPARISHLWVVPQGDRTWLGYGDDDAAVRERLRAARDGSSTNTTTRADASQALVGGHSTTNALVTMLAPEKSIIAGGGEDRISMSLVTEPKALVVKLRGSRQAAIDLGKTFL